MFMVIPNEGKLLFLARALISDPADTEDYIVRLFQNDYTPDDDSTAGLFDEADFAGYAPFDVADADFSTPVIVADVAETTAADPPTFTCTDLSPQTVYGWYMQGVDTGTVYAAQRFDLARVMVVGSVEALDPFKFRLKTFVICP